MTARPILAAALVWLGACARLPGPMAPPPQHAPEMPVPPPHYLLFREPESMRRVLEGLSGEVTDDWRWARKRAVLRLAVDETQGIFFQAVLVAPEEFVRSGAGAIHVRLDGRPLGEIPIERPGYVAWKRPVPEEWLEAGREIEVVLEAGAEWLQGNTPRSYMLLGAGFTP